MSYLLEALGRGLLGQLLDAFRGQLHEDETETLETLQRRREDCPTSADLATRLGLVYLRELRLADARTAFETAVELSDGATAPLLGLACTYDDLGQIDRALHCLGRAQAHDPTDPAIAFGIALCHERRGELEAAVANYERSVALCPGLRNGYERLAAIAVSRGDWPLATTCYERLARLEPGDLDVLMMLAALHLQADRPFDAISGFQQALLVEPECGETPGVSATELAENDGVQEAITALEALVEKYPGVSEFRVHLADLYARTHNDDGAIHQYHSALQLQPNFLEATVKLGTQHMRQQRYAEAAQAFNRAVELNDRLLTAFVGLGVAQHAGGRAEEAAATFDLAIGLAPNSTLLFSEAARLHLRAEQRRDRRRPGCDLDAPGDDVPDSEELLSEAVRRHRQALIACPNHADLHYRYGLLMRHVGDLDEAICAFRSAIAINPVYIKALIKLGISLKEAGRSDEAIEVFQRALSLRPEYVDMHYQLGLLFAQRNRFDLAVEQFEQSIEGNPRNLSFRQNLALALQNIGMVDRASATWRAICELSRENLVATTQRMSPAGPPGQ